MAASPLRAVGPNEHAPARRAPLTVGAAAKEGGRRDLLVAMRDRIAMAMESPTCPPRDLAALSLRLIAIVKDIEAIDVEEPDGSDGGESRADEAFDPASL